MTWTDDMSAAPERELNAAWQSLNRSFPQSRLSLWVQHALTACVRDTVTFASVLREQHDVLAQDFEKFLARHAGYTTPQQWMDDVKENSDETMRLTYRYAAGIRAIYFFIRALQDAAYRGFVEVHGDRSGGSNSMKSCANNSESHIHKLIAGELPDYFAWFVEHRDVRNSMKIGVDAYSSYAKRGNESALTVGLNRIVEDPPASVHYRHIGMKDVDKALQQSAALVALLDRTIRARAES